MREDEGNREGREERQKMCGDERRDMIDKRQEIRGN